MVMDVNGLIAELGTLLVTLKKRLSYNNPNLINVTHRCGEIVSTKRIGD